MPCTALRQRVALLARALAVPATVVAPCTALRLLVHLASAVMVAARPLRAAPLGLVEKAEPVAATTTTAAPVVSLPSTARLAALAVAINR